MGYVASLIIAAATLAAFTIGPFHGTYDRLKARVITIAAPASQQEKLISTLQQKQQVLGAFLANSASTAKSLAPKDRDTYQKALDSFNESKSLLTDLAAKAREENPGIVQTVIKKLLAPDTRPAEPTSIPPGCNLVCK